MQRYQPRLLAFCRHMLGSREDAEDVLQEVFAASFKALRADDRPINARPWLYRIARNRCLNHLRRPRATGQDSMDVFERDGGVTTADTVHRREEFRQIVADVQELPETQRTALLLREIDALSYDQIAEAMETTVPSVKSLLVRARVSLAEAAEARLLTCDEVRLELGQVAEGIARSSPPVRRHLKSCDRCRTFKVELRKTNRALAAIYPIGPLLFIKKLWIAKLGCRRGRERRGRGRLRRRCRRRRGSRRRDRRGGQRHHGRRRSLGRPLDDRLEGSGRNRRRRDRHRRCRRGQARDRTGDGARACRPRWPRALRRRPRRRPSRPTSRPRGRRSRSSSHGSEPAPRESAPAAVPAVPAAPVEVPVAPEPVPAPAPVQEDGSTVTLPPRDAEPPVGPPAGEPSEPSVPPGEATTTPEPPPPAPPAGEPAPPLRHASAAAGTSRPVARGSRAGRLPRP